MNGAVGKADLKRHNLADESISEHDADKEAKKVPEIAVKASLMAARIVPTP